MGIDLIATNHFHDYDCDVEHNTYLVGQVKAHGTHSLAVHYGLRLKFCACCGAHAQNRSNNLSKPCKRTASHAGKEALRLIYKGKLPSTYLQVHLNRRDLKVRLVSLKFKPRMPLRFRKNSFRARCVPNTIFRTHRRNLGVPAPSSLGLPNPLLEGGSMAS